MLFHLQKFFAFAFQHFIKGNAGPAADDRGDIAVFHDLVKHSACGLSLRFLQLLLHLRDDAVGQLARAGKIAFALRLLQLGARLVDLLFQLLRAAQLFLLGAPARGQIGGFLLQFQQIGFQRFQPFAGGVILLALQGFALDLHLDDLAVDLVDFFGLAVYLHAQTRRRFIDQIDCFIGQKTVGDITIGQSRRRNDRAIRDADAVMQLILFLQTAQDRDCVCDAWLAHENRLEAPRESRIFFDIFTVFVQGRGTDAMQFAARQSGLQHIRRIHRAIRLARADQGMKLINKNDDLACGGRDFLQNRFQTFLEFAAIFGTRDQCAQIQRENLLVFQAFRYIAANDALRQTLDDGGFAHAWLTNQHRIVFRAARQNLNRAADFFIAPDHGIHFAIARGLGQITRVFFQRVIALLRRSAVGFASGAHIIDGFVQRIGGHTPGNQRLLGGRIQRQSQGDQHAFDGDKAIASFFGDFIHRGQKTREVGRHAQLIGAALSIDFGDFAQFSIDGAQGLLGIASRRANQACRHAFLIVQ